MKESTSNFFVLLTKLTLIALMLVVVAGGLVRMTGSGMGCPDWPKCFGQYIPPTNISQLPVNYKTIYAEKRKKKIARFADLLDNIGLTQQASDLRNDDTILFEQNFSAFNTWTEFINRLIGAISGFLVLGVFLCSWAYVKNKKWLIFLCGIQLILLAFQAWMGAMTVATNLTPWVLSIHMITAIVLIALQIKIIRVARGEAARTILTNSYFFKGLLYFGIAISTIQILAGADVRQLIDGLHGHVSRENWIVSLGSNWFFHRSFALAVLAINAGLFIVNSKRNMRLTEVNWLMAIVFLEALAGMGMAYFAVPAILQPIHLVLAILMIAIQFHLTHKINCTKKS